MKEFLAGSAMMLLLSVFLIQFTSNQILHDKLMFAQQDIDTCLQEIKQDGYITTEKKTKLADTLKETLKLDNASEITIESTTTTPVYRGELIDYTIKITVKNVIGAAGFLGIAEDSNKVTKTYSGYIASEYIDFEESGV